MSTETFHVEAFIFVIILIVYVLTSHVIENKRVPYAHESSIAILMGIITAFISKYVRTNICRSSINKLTSPMTFSLSSSYPLSSSPLDIALGNRSFFKILESSAFLVLLEQLSGSCYWLVIWCSSTIFSRF